MKRPLCRTTVSLLASLIAFAAPSYSQEQRAGDASIRLEYQFIRTGSFTTDTVDFDYWTTDTQVALLSGDYAINDRWTVFAALPYVRKRFNAAPDPNNPFHPPNGDPHNPNDPYWIDFVPPDKRFWDDGDYHGAFQDFSIGVSYRIARGPWTLHPYVSYGVPASDYPFFAKSAIGLNLWTVPVGIAFNYVPYFSDWHFDGNVAYVISEKPLGRNVDYWLGDLSAGYGQSRVENRSGSLLGGSGRQVEPQPKRAREHLFDLDAPHQGRLCQQELDQPASRHPARCGERQACGAHFRLSRRKGSDVQG